MKKIIFLAEAKPYFLRLLLFFCELRSSSFDSSESLDLIYGWKIQHISRVTPSCGKPARLQCSKCVELKLPSLGASFCTQDCFKTSWSSHKSVHVKANPNTDAANEGWLYCLKKGQKRSSTLPYFDWTGTLRPYPISKTRLVPDSIEKPD